MEGFSGSLNRDGNPHGRGTLNLSPEGDLFMGRFKDGCKEGSGQYIFHDGSVLKGKFTNDNLNGPGEYLYQDGTFMRGVYRDGELDGIATTFAPDGETVLAWGVYETSIPVRMFMSLPGDGSLEGPVNDEGLHHGLGCFYRYPDGVHVLIGEWDCGEMLWGLFGKLDSTGIFLVESGAVLEYNFSEMLFSDIEVLSEARGQRFRFDCSTSNKISSDCMLADSFEKLHVYVAQSLIPGANEGLFAKKELPADFVCTFYNGIRVPHNEVDARDWSLNDNTISLDDDIVIDVPPSFSSITEYCSSLAHKANHSFTPNSMYDVCTHPRFGEIKCIRTLVPLNANDEILVDYGYSHDTLPEWYSSKKP